MKSLAKISKWIFIGLLAYMPLHVFLSTWIGSSLDVLDSAKVAKDILLVIGASITLYLWLKDNSWKKLFRNRLFILIILYTSLTLLLAAFKKTDVTAEILGVVYNLRFLVMFVYGWLLNDLCASNGSAGDLRSTVVKYVMFSAFVVAVFGVIQYLFLPNDALGHVGYSTQNGVFPAFFIDNKPDLERIMSTLRDPNSLGSYLIIIISMIVSWIVSKKPNTNKLEVLILLSVVCLVVSFSRSAWIGTLAALASIMLLSRSKASKSKKLNNKKPALIMASVITVCLLTVGLGVFRGSYLVQNIILHSDKSTTMEDPNELRVKFIKESFDNIASNPEGLGPGRAGLASIKNTKQGTILNENYYLQIATEVGVFGLVLFVMIYAAVLKRLFVASSGDWLALALFCSGIGLLITNLLVHIWSNEAVAYTWWGLSGVILANFNSIKE